MNVSRPVYWHEGLFLRPEHFQQQDLYYQHYTSGIVRMNNPYCWGVKSFTLLQSALNNQIVEVERCELVFQDGSHVICPDNAIAGRRNISGKWDESRKPLSIWLGLRKIQVGKSNISQDDINTATPGSCEMTATRFIAPETTATTYDLFSEEKQAEISYLQHNLQIFIGDEVLKAVDFQLIKIAELHKTDSETVISRQYIPPTLSVDSSDLLFELLRELKGQLMSKARELDLYKQDRGLDTNKSCSVDPIYFHALLVLNRYSQQFHHFLETGAVMPWLIYGVLRQLAGELSTFSKQYSYSDDGSDFGLPAYDHESIMHCFKETTLVINDLLRDIIAGPDYMTPLLFDGTYYCAHIKDCDTRRNNTYYLRVSMHEEINDVIEYMHARAKLSSKEQLPLLLAHSLPGVVLQYEDSPPINLPRSPDFIYFKLQACGENWDAVISGLNTSIYFDNPPDSIKIDLMVMYG